MPTHVAVFAAAEHRAPNARTGIRSRIGIRIADDDMRLVGIAEEEVAGVVVARRLSYVLICEALRGAVHIAVVDIGGIKIAVAADGAAIDFDGGDTAVLVRIVGAGSETCLLAVTDVVALTHRGRVTAAKHIVQDGAVIDLHLRVAIHLARRNASDYRGV